MFSAAPYGRLNYDTHAMFAGHLRASARVDSRDPMVDSVLIVGHTAPVSGSARESALRREWRCCAWSRGKRAGQLAARADAELGEDLAQMVGDGGGADEQLRGDLRVGGAVPGQPGDQRFLRGQGIWRLDGAFADLATAGPQLDARPFGKRRGADRIKDLMGAGELIAGVTPAPLAAQPLAVDQVGAPQFHPQAGAAETVDRLTVEVLGVLAVADQRPRAGLDTKHPVGLAGAGYIREPLHGAGRTLRHPAVHRRLDQLDERPAGELNRRGILTPPLRRGQRLLIAAHAVVQHGGRPPDKAKGPAFTPALR